MKLWEKRILLFFLILSTAPVFSQHDPQRNATQAIALGEYEKAEKILAKADADDPETLFVQMMSALKQGDKKTSVVKARAGLLMWWW